MLLVFSQAPESAPQAQPGGLSFSETMALDYSDLPVLENFKARDGAELSFRRYESSTPSKTGIVLVHGSGWHGMQYHAMAKALAKEGRGNVYVPDMRGHGVSPQKRGDIDYIAQLEDDLADLIEVISAEVEPERLVVVGHSSGGGFVLRFAGGAYGEMADGYVFLAPFLRHDAPTTNANSGGWAHPAVRRIIGLTMLNTVKITALNHLPVISFAMPKQVLEGPYGDTATTQYTYAMNTGFGPRDYEADLKAMTRPFLLVAGSEDSSFKADLYEPTMASLNAGGTYEVLEDLSHIGVVTEPAAIEVVAGWIDGLRR